jgi:hypothetical protein
MNGAQYDLTTARQVRRDPLVGLGTSLPSKERRDFDTTSYSCKAFSLV